MPGSFQRGVFDDSLVAQDLQILGGTPFGLGVALTGVAKILQSLTPASVAANSSVEQTFTVPGLLLNDNVDVSTPSLVAGIICTNSRCSAANTLAIQFANVTAGALTPPAGIYNIIVLR